MDNFFFKASATVGHDQLVGHARAMGLELEVERNQSTGDPDLWFDYVLRKDGVELTRSTFASNIREALAMYAAVRGIK